jgi:hypothetical protein
MLAYADELTVTVTDENISVPSTVESGYTQFVLERVMNLPILCPTRESSS